MANSNCSDGKTIATPVISIVNDILLKSETVAKKPKLDSDISSILDEYIELWNDYDELLKAGIINKNLNFSDAGILLQNCATVYNKKIDFLQIEIGKLHEALRKFVTVKPNKSISEENKKKRLNKNQAKNKNNDPNGNVPPVETNADYSNETDVNADFDNDSNPDVEIVSQFEDVADVEFVMEIKSESIVNQPIKRIPTSDEISLIDFCDIDPFDIHSFIGKGLTTDYLDRYITNMMKMPKLYDYKERDMNPKNKCLFLFNSGPHISDFFGGGFTNKFFGNPAPFFTEVPNVKPQKMELVVQLTRLTEEDFLKYNVKIPKINKSPFTNADDYLKNGRKELKVLLTRLTEQDFLKYNVKIPASKNEDNVSERYQDQIQDLMNMLI